MKNETFFWEDYLILNTDIINHNNENGALTHYKNHGQKEQRQTKLQDISKYSFVYNFEHQKNSFKNILHEKYGLQLNMNEHYGNKNYEVGLEKLGEYMELAKSNGVDKSVYESAAIPIMTTHMFGGRYKPGQFGWGPGDAKAKHDAACLLPETVPLFKENIKKLKCMSPAYDVIAFIKMMS